MGNWVSNTPELFDIIIDFLTTPPVFNIVVLLLFIYVCHLIHILIKGD